MRFRQCIIHLICNALRNPRCAMKFYLGCQSCHRIEQAKMADTNLNVAIINMFLTVLLTLYSKNKDFNDGELLLEVSDYVLAKYWEAGRTYICIYRISAFVYRGGFPAATSNKRKLYKGLSTPHKRTPITTFVTLIEWGYFHKPRTDPISV